MTSGDEDRRARFDVLARQAYVPLRRYLSRRVAADAVEDVLADTLLVMWRRLEDIPEEAALAWCYGAARRCLANAVRAGERRENLLRRLAAQPRELGAGLQGQPSGAFDDVDSDGVLSRALAGLPETDREILRLWAWEQLDPRELAVVLGISANAASIRLHRATRRLRQSMTGQPSAPPTRKTRGGPGHEHARQDGSQPTEAPR